MNEQIKQELDAIQNRLNELRQIVESPHKEHKRTIFDLEDGDEYWAINFIDLEPYKIKWSNNKIEINMKAMGMVFLTKENCQKAIDAMKAKTLWKKTMAELNDGWQPDWSNKDKYKYNYYIDHKTNNLMIDYRMLWQSHQNDMYAMSEEILKKAREILGDEVTRLAWIEE